MIVSSKKYSKGKTLEGWELQVPDLAALPRVGDVRDCIFVASTIQLVDGQVKDEAVNRFWARIQRLVNTNHIEGLWGTPGALIVGSEDHKSHGLLLYVYVKKSKTMDEPVFSPELDETVLEPKEG